MILQPVGFAIVLILSHLLAGDIPRAGAAESDGALACGDAVAATIPPRPDDDASGHRSYVLAVEDERADMDDLDEQRGRDRADPVRSCSGGWCSYDLGPPVGRPDRPAPPPRPRGSSPLRC